MYNNQIHYTSPNQNFVPYGKHMYVCMYVCMYVYTQSMYYTDIGLIINDSFFSYILYVTEIDPLPLEYIFKF